RRFWRCASWRSARRRLTGSSTRQGSDYLRRWLLGLAQIGQDRVERAEALDGVVVGDGGGDDQILALLPVGRRRHLMPGRKLDRVDGAQDLVEVAARRHRIGEDQLDLLVRADDVDGADGGIVGRGAAFRTVTRCSRQHVVELGYF